MEKFKKTEIIILAILWVMSLITFSIALLNNYVLYTSDYVGMIGLAIVTSIAYFKPEKSLQSVLILLFLGLFNLLSFAYFFNIVLTIGFSELVTPEIQLISFVFLIILIVRKRDEIGQLYRSTFVPSEEEKEKIRQSSQNQFKRKFEQLSDKDIENKLQQDLVPEAISALNQIKEERKNVLQQGI